MFGRFLLIVFALSSQGSFAFEFFISEVYAKSPGRGSSTGKQWIEIAHLGATTLSVTQLSVEILGKNNTVQFSHDKNFLSPVTLEDFLLIAPAKNLGLSHCLRSATIVTIPDFAFNYRTAKSICITINGERQCVSVDLTKVAAGTSVYRRNENEPLVRHEPCLMVDTIFATPGKQAKYCGSSGSMKEHLTACDLEPALGRTFSLKKLVATSNKPPVIQQARAEIHNRETTIRASFVDYKENGPWVFTLCRTPPSSNKICHVVDSPQQVFPESEIVVPLKSQNLGMLLTVEVKDVFGAIGRKEVVMIDGVLYPGRAEKWQPKLEMRGDPTPVLLVTLLDDEVPCNFAIEQGQKNILQFSLLRAGQHVIEMPKKIHHQDFVVLYSSLKNHGQVVLRNSAKFNAESS